MVRLDFDFALYTLASGHFRGNGLRDLLYIEGRNGALHRNLIALDLANQVADIPIGAFSKLLLEGRAAARQLVGRCVGSEGRCHGAIPMNFCWKNAGRLQH